MKIIAVVLYLKVQVINVLICTVCTRISCIWRMSSVGHLADKNVRHDYEFD